MKDISWYKENIDLPRFIVDNYDFVFDKLSTRNSPKLRSSDGAQVITLKKYATGWRYFFKTSSEKGSIIDFVQNRENIFDLGRVRGIIDKYMGTGFYSPSLSQQQSPGQIEVKPLSDYRTPVFMSVKNREYTFRLKDLDDFDFLNIRLGDGSILKSTHFHGCVFNSVFQDNTFDKSYTNTTFPVYSFHQLQNPHSSNPWNRRVAALQTYYFAPDGSTRKIFYGPRGDGFWRSNVNPNLPVTRLFLTEQPLDAISHFMLHPDLVNENVVYFSYFGQISKEQLNRSLEFIQDGLFLDMMNMQRFNVAEQIVFSFDNDAAGYRYTFDFLGGLDAAKIVSVAAEFEYLNKAEFLPTRWEKSNDISKNDAEICVSFPCNNIEQGTEFIAKFKQDFRRFKTEHASAGHVFFNWSATQIEHKQARIHLEFKNRRESWQVINDFLVACKFCNSPKLQFDFSAKADWNDELKHSADFKPVEKKNESSVLIVSSPSPASPAKIISKTNFTSQEKSEFRDTKFRLRSLDYPAQESLQFVQEYFTKCASSVLKHVPAGANLIVTPSSSRRNVLALLFSRLIADHVKDVKIFNASGECARPVHNYEAKDRLSIYSRYTELIDFDIFVSDGLRSIAQHNHNYIVEDWAATGESCVNFQKRLAQSGIKVNNIISLISSGVYFTSRKQITAFYNKFTPHVAHAYHAAMKQAFEVFFNGYLEGKLRRFALYVSRHPDKMSEVAHSIMQFSANYRKANMLFSVSKNMLMHTDVDLAVIGSRSFNDYALLSSVLDSLNFTRLISGGAKGADSLAERYAQERGIPIVVIKPDYGAYPGKVAPIMRNKDIIGLSNQVVAFWDGNSKGTLNAVSLARKQGVPVRVVDFNGNHQVNDIKSSLNKNDLQL